MSLGRGSLSLKVEGAFEASSGGSERVDFCRRSIFRICRYIDSGDTEFRIKMLILFFENVSLEKISVLL